MIWAAERNRQQAGVVRDLYEAAWSLSVPCGRSAVIAGGLSGADKDAALAAAGIESSRHLVVSVDSVLHEMAAQQLIPEIAGLSPLEGSGPGTLVIYEW